MTPEELEAIRERASGVASGMHSDPCWRVARDRRALLDEVDRQAAVIDGARQYCADVYANRNDSRTPRRLAIVTDLISILDEER